MICFLDVPSAQILLLTVSVAKDEYEDDPRLGGPASTYLIDHNPIYSGHQQQQLPPPRPAQPLGSLYGTMPRKTTGYTYDEDLSRQRFIHSLGEERRGQLT